MIYRLLSKPVYWWNPKIKKLFAGLPSGPANVLDNDDNNLLNNDSDQLIVNEI